MRPDASEYRNYLELFSKLKSLPKLRMYSQRSIAKENTKTQSPWPMFFKRRKTCLVWLLFCRTVTFVYIQILFFSFNPLFGGLLSFLVWTVRGDKKAWKLQRIKNELFLNGNNVREFPNVNTKHGRYVKENTLIELCTQSGL